MAKGNIVRYFLQHRHGALKKEIHVRRLLLSKSLRGVFTPEERRKIETEYSEPAKCELFLQIVFSKDDHTVEKFMNALEEKQLCLKIREEWQLYQVTNVDRNELSFTSNRDPVESVDESEVAEKDVFSVSDNCQSLQMTSDTDWNVKAGPLSADLMKNTVPVFPTGQCEGEPSIAAQVIHCLEKHIEMSLFDKTDLENRINQAVMEQDFLRDVNHRLVDILVKLVRQQRLSPYVVEQALKDMGLGDLAEKLIYQTVHDSYIDQLPAAALAELTQQLSVKHYSRQGDNLRRLAEKLDVDVNIDFLDQRMTNPAQELLNIWKQKRSATVSNLYRILISMDAAAVARILEPYLPVAMLAKEGEATASSPYSNSVDSIQESKVTNIL